LPRQAQDTQTNSLNTTTFLQGTYSAACVDVEDRPRFAHRELMLDSGRFFLPIPLLMRAADAMAMTKLNVLHLHAVRKRVFFQTPFCLKPLNICKTGSGQTWENRC
jgi:N-acetyl-beta-hexosaminidase